MDMEKMNVKMVEIIENGGMGVCLYRVWNEVLEGKNFEEMVGNKFKELMKNMDEEYFESDFYEVEGIIDGVGIIRFGEDCGVYVISENNEWFNKDCEDGKFYNYIRELSGVIY